MQLLVWGNAGMKVPTEIPTLDLHPGVAHLLLRKPFVSSLPIALETSVVHATQSVVADLGRWGSNAYL